MPGATFDRDLVLYELQRLNDRVEAAASDLHDRIDTMDSRNREDHQRVVEQLGEIEKDLTHLKVRSSAWGAVGGALATVAAFVAQSIGWPTGHA